MLNKIKVLGSSSKGNAYVLYFDSKVIQLDAGVKNGESKKVDVLFLSHDHIDHNKFVKDFKTVVKPNGENIELNGITGNAIPVYHTNLDGSEIPNNAYLINCEDDTILYLTDCGDYSKMIGDDTNGIKYDIQYIIIECNGDYFAVKDGRIKVKDYGKRAMGKGGHLSNLDCLKILSSGVQPGTKILFVHKSENHTCDKTFKLFDVLDNKGLVAEKGQIIYAKSGKDL